jgi:cathepsin L
VAASAAIQFQAAKNYKNFNKVLSPQSMLSCTPNKMECGGQGGCKGATPELGFEWAKRQGVNGGILPMDQEDYTATDGGATCEGPKKVSFLQLGLQKQQPASLAAVSIGGWRKVEENKASKVIDALVTTGPLAVAIVGREIQGYESGVIDTCNKNFVVDHAVVMMGYGNDPNYGMYWNIRNSWGSNWGEGGYMRLRRHTPKGEEPCGWDNNP